MEDIPDGHVLTRPWPRMPKQKQKPAGRRSKVTHYRHRASAKASWRSA